MARSSINPKVLIGCLAGICMLYIIACGDDLAQDDVVTNATEKYMNHHDSAKYVGMGQCRLCHQDIYESFSHTGMGMSFGTANKEKSSANFPKDANVKDVNLDYNYHPHWSKDSLYIYEYRLEGRDTTYKNNRIVSYIIGSGQHTNSHIVNTNGYLYQAPLTYYTQEGNWDLPPGFDDGRNSRFTRKIGLECMTCHNAYPDFVKGSENKFTHVPLGIDCERCHGPGSIHVELKSKGVLVDTSKYVDYSIVNPGKLPIDLQFDLCQRCHLQGNTVLKEGKSFYDFKPGMKLSDVMTVFLPRYTNSDEEFIMASHADRIKMSKCYIESLPEKEAGLRPYKEALTCVTCHNPHVSVKTRSDEFFNQKCNSCHVEGKAVCTEDENVRTVKANNCISCHMPKSSSSDIPHVSITDHFIRPIIKEGEKTKIKEFLSLYAVNENQLSALVRIKGYINQYEKFEAEPFYLDSAFNLLSDLNVVKNKEAFTVAIHLYYLQLAYERIDELVEKRNVAKVLSEFSNVSFDNSDAWTLYRIGQAYINTNNVKKALAFYEHAVKLAPFVSEFKNKLASVYLAEQQLNKAKELFVEIVNEDPSFVPAHSNLGYCLMLENEPDRALIEYEKALQLDPDYLQAMFNMAAYNVYLGKRNEAKVWLEKVLRKDPNNGKAKQALVQLK